MNLYSLFRKLFSRESDDILKLDTKMVFSLHRRRIPRLSQIKYARRLLPGREFIVLTLGVLAIALGSVILALQFYREHRIEVPAVGGIYREGVIGKVGRINPLYSSLNAVDRDVTSLVFSSLLHYDTNSRLTPDIAKSIEIDENKTTYTLNLRDDVLFHNGDSLTAQDVEYTVSLIQKGEIKSPLKATLFNVKVEAVNDHTIVFKLDEPFEQFENFLTFGILPKSLWEQVPAEEVSNHFLNNEPIGSGPYIFKQIIPATDTEPTTIRLERNPNFYRTPPSIREIEIKVASSADELLEFFLKQEIDGVAAISGDDIERIGKRRASLYTFNVPEYTGLFFNQLYNKNLKRVAVREALSLAINKDNLVEEVLPGRAKSAHTPFIEGSDGYVEGSHTFDTEKAIKLLDDDGWEQLTRDEYLEKRSKELIENWIKEYKNENNSDPSEEETQSELVRIIESLGEALDPLQPYFRARDNQFLELVITYVDHKDALHTAEIVQASWRSIGIHVKIEPVSSSVVEREILRNHNYDVLLIGVVLATNPDPYPLWYDASNETRATIARFVDRALDDILEQARDTKKAEKRTELYKKFQEHLLAKKHAIVLYNPTFSYAIHKRVKGVVANSIATPVDRFAGIENWYIKTKKQWK